MSCLMLYSTTHCPVLCAVSLDDSRLMPQLVLTHKLIDDPEGWTGESEENYSWTFYYHAHLASEITLRTGTIPKLWLKLGAKLILDTPYPPQHIADRPSDAIEARHDFTWYEFSGIADKRMLLRALWRDEDPVWTHRVHPQWINDRWIEPPYADTDYAQLCRQARVLCKPFDSESEGEIKCPRCGDDLHYKATNGWLTLLCSRLYCIKWETNKISTRGLVNSCKAS